MFAACMVYRSIKFTLCSSHPTAGIEDRPALTPRNVCNDPRRSCQGLAPCALFVHVEKIVGLALELKTWFVSPCLTVRYRCVHLEVLTAISTMGTAQPGARDGLCVVFLKRKFI